MGSEKGKIQVEIVQKHHKVSDLDHNMAIIREALKNSGSDLLIFPEMFLTGYNLGDDVFSFSQDIDRGPMKELADLCREQEKYLILGFPERSSEIKGQVHNSACIFGPKGVMGVYRKMHPVDFGPFEEWAYFTPGKDLAMVQINGFKIGVIICYDIFFPELTKLYALNGSDMVVCISASPSVTRKFFESVMLARAIENTIYFAYSNLVGFDTKMDFWGGGAIIGPRGDMIAKGPYYEEASIKATMERQSLEEARKLRPTIRDTRTELLEELSRVGRIRGP